MNERSVSRRDVLRTTGGLASLGIVSGLSGCSGITGALGGNGGTNAVETVPADSQYVLEVDFTAMYEDDALRDGINEELSSVREEMGSEEIPEDVTGALDRIEEEAGLDPQSMSEAILSGTYEGDAEEDQAAYTFWTEWSEEDLLDVIEEEGASYTEESYGDTTVYAPEQPIQSGAPTRMAVLEEGVFTIGTQTHVEATIDTHNGDEDPVSGEVRDGYDASTDGHLRYAFDVVSSEVPESTGGEVDPSVFTDVTYGYGSLSEDGSDRVMSLNLETDDEEATGEVTEVIEGALSMAEQQIEESETEDSEELLTALEATEVSGDGTTTAVTHTRAAEEFAAVATPVLLSFVMPAGASASASSRESMAANAPQASFSFQLYESSADSNQLALAHDGGDSIPASQLSLRGSGFAENGGADQVEPGPWQGTTTDGDVAAGDIVYVGVFNDYEIQVVWQSAESDQSAVLASGSGPDA